MEVNIKVVGMKRPLLIVLTLVMLLMSVGLVIFIRISTLNATRADRAFKLLAETQILKSQLVTHQPTATFEPAVTYTSITTTVLLPTTTFKPTDTPPTTKSSPPIPTLVPKFIVLRSWDLINFLQITQNCIIPEVMCWETGGLGDRQMSLKERIFIDPAWKSPSLGFTHQYSIPNDVSASVRVQVDEKWLELKSFPGGKKYLTRERLSLEEYSGKSIMIQFEVPWGSTRFVRKYFYQMGTRFYFPKELKDYSKWHIEDICIFTDNTIFP
jgi:hypothetical protein